MSTRPRPAHRAAPPAGPVTLLRAVAGEALGLVVPLACAGCGHWDVVLCPSCAALLAGDPFRCEQDAPRLDVSEGALPVWAAASYAGPVRDAVVAWKDRGRTDVGPWLSAAVRTAARVSAPTLSVAAGDAPVAVVPVPSRPGARLRRGGDRTAVLALACAAGLRVAGVRAEVYGGLAVRGISRDQVGLGARARGRNLRSGLRVRKGVDAGGRWCVLVDDVLTTGSTLAAAGRALAAAGARPLAAVVLAATPAPSRTTDSSPGVRPGRSPDGPLARTYVRFPGRSVRDNVDAWRTS